MVRFKYIILLFAFSLSCNAFGQGDINDLLYGEVENIYAVYKPVIGFGVGTFNFLGDVKDPNQNPFTGALGYKVNIATFLDNKHLLRANFFAMAGALSGNERSYSDPMRNLNFKSDILMFGFNINYDFDNFYKTARMVHPFISVGFETITFDSKIDSIGNGGVKYNYWNDGSIRNTPEGTGLGTIMSRDHNYETGLKQYNWGLDYPQYTFAVPIDIGLDFWLSSRVLFRVGTSYHIVFTDAIDHVSHKNDPELGVVGDKRNDDFMFSYFSLHLDLFSSDKEIAWNKLAVEVEWDPTLMGDEDGDGRFDGYDDCPGTPWGVEIDSVGCALDDDLDVIPNYLDDEPNSRYGAMVDDRGVEMTEEEVIALIDQSNAVPREDVSMYVRTPTSYANYKRITSSEIPPKFDKIDSDEDAYISFDEMMDAIDKFFDFDSELESEDIYELNEFFFSQ